MTITTPPPPPNSRHRRHCHATATQRPPPPPPPAPSSPSPETPYSCLPATASHTPHQVAHAGESCPAVSLDEKEKLMKEVRDYEHNRRFKNKIDEINGKHPPDGR